MMNFKNIPRTTHVIGYIAGLILVIISSILTAILFESMATGTWMGKMFSIAGVCVDVGKIVTASAFVYYIAKKQYTSSLLPFSLYILAFVVSMVASQSLDLNKANIIKNETIIASDEYKFNNATIESSELDIQRYLNDIKSIENSEQARIEQSIEHLEAERKNAKNRDWITTPLGSPRRGVDVIDRDIATVKKSVREQIQYEIKQIKNDIKDARKNQNKAKDNISNLKNGGGILATCGLIAFAEWMNPSNPTKVLGWFYLFKNVFCEVLGTYLMLSMNICSSRKRAEIQPEQSDELSSKRLSKSSNEQSDELSNEQIKKFIQAKKKYPRLGYKGISKKIGMPEGKCSKIQVHLVNKGILKKHGNTYKIG